MDLKCMRSNETDLFLLHIVSVAECDERLYIQLLAISFRRCLGILLVLGLQRLRFITSKWLTIKFLKLLALRISWICAQIDASDAILQQTN